MVSSVAIVITVYRNPQRLAALLDNMRWAGIPDVPIYVFEDPSPYDDRSGTTEDYLRVCLEKGISSDNFMVAPKWCCMHGIIDFAFCNTKEEWIIYVPDDIIFTKGGLWNEYGGVLTYGREWVGGIQAPYWNATDLVSMQVMPYREAMFNRWCPDNVPQNPHWNGMEGLPRKYINLNGAGFSLNRRLFEKMGGWPRQTWRLDEYAGLMAWRLGFCCITLPGPPRIHYFGGTTSLQPQGCKFHTAESWREATGGLPEETGLETYRIMERIPTESWLDVFAHFEGRKAAT